MESATVFENRRGFAVGILFCRSLFGFQVVAEASFAFSHLRKAWEYSGK